MISESEIDRPKGAKAAGQSRAAAESEHQKLVQWAFARTTSH